MYIATSSHTDELVAPRDLERDVIITLAKAGHDSGSRLKYDLE